MTDQETSKKEKASSGSKWAWGFGVLFVLSGIASVFSDPILGLAMLVIGAVLLPPVTEFVDRKWKLRLTRNVKIAVVIVCLAAIGLTADSSPSTNSDSETQNKSQSEEEQIVTKPLTEEEKIRALVQEELKGNNNLGASYEKKIDVVEQIDGGWGVFVEFNASDGLSTSSRKSIMEQKMSEIYIALYTSEFDIRSASASAYFPLVDKYGNESSDVVYKSILEKTEADKVNWDTDEATLIVSILPGVWTTSILHPEFQ